MRGTYSGAAYNPAVAMGPMAMATIKGGSQISFLYIYLIGHLPVGAGRPGLWVSESGKIAKSHFLAETGGGYAQQLAIFCDGATGDRVPWWLKRVANLSSLSGLARFSSSIIFFRADLICLVETSSPLEVDIAVEKKYLSS